MKYKVGVLSALTTWHNLTAVDTMFQDHYFCLDVIVVVVVVKVMVVVI